MATVQPAQRAVDASLPVPWRSVPLGCGTSTITTAPRWGRADSRLAGNPLPEPEPVAPVDAPAAAPVAVKGSAVQGAVPLDAAPPGKKGLKRDSPAVEKS